MRWYLILMIALQCLPAAAQEAVTLETQVTFIAGQTVYVASGSDDGLVAGATVDVYRDARKLGAMRIVSATGDRAVLGFVGNLFSITMGDHLTLSLEPITRDPEALQPPPTDPDRPSILAQANDAAPDQVYRVPHVSGRLQLGINTLMSSTSSGDGAQTDRTYATPFALLRAEVDDLPGGLKFSTRLRTAYRYADPTPFSEEVDVRVYDLSLEKSFSALPLEIRAGRFYNPYDRFSGYWDGLNVHVGGRERGVGISAGLQPDRGNELPVGDMPKYTVYGHAAYEADGIRLDGTILGGQILPTADGLRNRTFAGIDQNVFAGNVRASAEALVDQDPETGDWVFSRLGGRVSVTASNGVRLHGFASSRRSYILFGDWQSLLPRTTRIGGGATVTLRNGTFRGLTIRGDVTSATAEGQPATLTFSGGVSAPRISSTGIGFSVDGTMWQNESLGEQRRGIYGGAGVTRSFGSTYARLGYRYQQSPLLGMSDLVTHGFNLLLQVPLRSGLALTLQATSQFGDLTSSTSVYSAIWYRF